jgi:hypothetical protein
LGDRGEQELIASTAHSVQPQASQVPKAFEVSEQDLNFLTIFARLFVKVGLGNIARHIAGVFINAARDFADRRTRTAARFHRARTTDVDPASGNGCPCRDQSGYSIQ